MENMPSHEKSSSDDKEAAPEEFKFYLDRIDSFLSRSDDPGRHITDSEKLSAIGSENIETLNKLVAEKTGGSYGGVKYVKSKYRKSAFSFLPIVELLSENEKFIKITSEEKRRGLLADARSLMERIGELRVKDDPITKEEVDRGIKIAEEIKEILKKK